MSGGHTTPPWHPQQVAAALWLVDSGLGIEYTDAALFTHLPPLLSIRHAFNLQFVVDGTWQHAESRPQVSDDSGNVNNVFKGVFTAM